MPRFMILAMEQERAPLADVSPAEMQAIIQRYVAWGDRMRAAGKLVDSNKLKDGQGKAVSGPGGKVIVRDGPYAESKEVVGGYWIVEAPDYDEVVEWTRSSPHLDFGTLLIRPIEEM